MDTQANKASSQPDRQMDKKKVFLLSGGHLSCDINTGALPAVIPYLQEFYGLFPATSIQAPCRQSFPTCRNSTVSPIRQRATSCLPNP